MSPGLLVRLVLGAVLAVAGLAFWGTARADEVAVSSVEASPGRVTFALTTPNLAADAVEVRAGDVPLTARVTSADRHDADLPTRAVVLVVDTSGSMAGERIATARQAALGYASSVPADVRVGLVAFADSPALLVAPTTDRAALAAALDTPRANGNTALYDALPVAVAALDGIAQPRLVVLSDGQDTSSRTQLDAATALLAGRPVPADVVALASDDPALGRIAAAGGGKVLAAAEAADLAEAFAAAARTFTHRVAVEVAVPDSLAGRTADLTVVASAGSSSVTATVPVAFAALPAAPAGPTAPAWSLELWLLVIGTFTAFLVAAVLLFGLVGRKETRDLDDRIGQYGRSRPAPEHEQSQVARGALTVTDNLLGGRAEAIAARLDLAGMAIGASEWALLRLCGAVVLGVVTALLVGNPWLGGPLGALAAVLGTHLYVSFRIGRRRSAFRDQLPDVLQLVAGSLQSGFSLAQALDAVVRDDTQPAAGEVARALAETRVGVDLTDALDRVADRMTSTDLKWIVMAVRIQRSVGGNLAEVLLTTVATMRDRAQTRRQVHALSAEGRLSAYILVALPIALATWLVLTRYEYMRPLFTTAIGWVLVGGATVMVGLGALWMRKLVRVEV
ncbi:VWA domain-containing protein [Saccharothrix variisporea]|uniref:Tight adherence protein B n=1 Tax=Saccharothrix variisporea TaxID=543527 RepID=A0A495X8Q4_9PSEU|nr:VWA domain-containing protein [Saccharothrix variisporea]RKT70580.1 tight adherence protein B [Saccharothrix variisporea]